jgi:hypothetical protein
MFHIDAPIGNDAGGGVTSDCSLYHRRTIVHCGSSCSRCGSVPIAEFGTIKLIKAAEVVVRTVKLLWNYINRLPFQF